MLTALLSMVLASQGDAIVVTARPLAALKADMEACVKQHCPTREDAAATLAYAESAFVAGDYKQARGALSAAIGRNRKSAATDPDSVSDLDRAYANVSQHLGEVDGYRRGTWNILRTVDAGVDSPLAKRLAAKLEVGDMQVSIGRPRDALGQYELVSKEAAKAGLTVLLAYADIRRGRMLYAFDRRKEARALLNDLAARPGTEMASFRLGARIVLQQLDHPNAEPDLDALRADPQGLPRDGRQALLWSPPPKDQSDQGNALKPDGSVPVIPSATRISSSYDGQWVDVGFHVRPDGHVENVEILRGAEGRNPVWAQDELARISGRLYSPLQDGVASPNADRVERLTYTSRYTQAWGAYPSRIPGRDGIARVERLDLTRDPTN